MRDYTLGYAVAHSIGDDSLITVQQANVTVGTDPPPLVVPGDQIWELVFVTGRLAASATVASRTIGVTIDNGATTLVRMGPPTLQTASNTLTYSGYAGAVGSAFAASVFQYVFGIAPVPLLSGWRIGFNTTNLQATDQWTNVMWTFRQRARNDDPLTREDELDVADQFAEYEHALERLGF